MQTRIAHNAVAATTRQPSVHSPAGGRGQQMRGGQQAWGVCAELQVKDPGAPPLQLLLLIVILGEVFQDWGARSVERGLPGQGRGERPLCR